MEKNAALFLLPLGAFLFHLGFSRVNLWYLGKEARRAVAVLNLFVYPALASILLALLFRYLLSGGIQGLLPGWTMGCACYYLSMVLGVLPFTGPFFREMDLEFMLLGIGVIEGAQASTFKGLLLALEGHSLAYWGLVFGAILGGLFLSMFTKYLVTSRMGYYDKKEEMLKGFVWGMSIASGVVTVPLILLFLAVAKP